MVFERKGHLLSAAAVALAAALVAGTAMAQSDRPSVDSLIALHIRALGGYQAIKAIRTLSYSDGRYAEPGFTGSGHSAMMLMRPYYKLVGDPGLKPEFMEGYDGAAWEWYASPGFVIRTVGAAAAAIRHYASVEDPLVDYVEKGSAVERGAPARIHGRPTYRLIVTMRDGFRTEWFLDRDTYLAIATRQCARIHAFGEEVCTQTTLGDYRPVAGVLYPHLFADSSSATGGMISTMHWGHLEANRDIPRRWFSPPTFERTPVQAFIEHLFEQRSDPEAVLWTYQEFRRTHHNVETAEAAGTVGYQMLKMGDLRGAIALLQANQSDYPSSAEAAFGLGRAYSAAGRKVDARAAYRRALELDPTHQQACRGLEALE